MGGRELFRGEGLFMEEAASSGERVCRWGGGGLSRPFLPGGGIGPGRFVQGGGCRKLGLFWSFCGGGGGEICPGSFCPLFVG